MSYIIVLNDLRGVELIVKALRERRCIASAELADGIERNAIYVDEHGNRQTLGEMAQQPPKLPGLKLAKG